VVTSAGMLTGQRQPDHGTKALGRRPLWWSLGAGGALGLLLLWRSRSAVEGRLHVVGRDGFVKADPEGLARAAGVPLDVYALASAMQREERTDRGRLAVGRAIWNAVGAHRSKIFAKLAPSGRFGTQEVNYYAATSVPPTDRTLGLAQAIVDGRVPDLVERSVQWDSPKTQDSLHALYLKDPARYPKYKRSSAEIAERRRSGGAREVWVPGVPDTRFWSYA
jgi:hypothetical protein